MSTTISERTAAVATNLRCQACLAKLTPVLDADKHIESWQADLSDPQKPVRAHLAAEAPSDALFQAVARAGYEARPLIDAEAAKAKDRPAGALPVVTATGNAAKSSTASAAEEKPPFRLATYKPLLLVVAYAMGAAALFAAAQPVWSWMAAMRYFMGFFFLGFAFFKLLDVEKFADAFAGYDIVAKRLRAYALAYPWIELALGLAFVLGIAPVLTNVVTALIMGVGLIGVVQAVRRKQTIQCACLGTAFNLPMSAVTIIENSVMIAMAIGMLLWMM